MAKKNQEVVASRGLVIMVSPALAARARVLADAEGRSVSSLLRGLLIQRVARADRARRPQ